MSEDDLDLEASTPAVELPHDPYPKDHYYRRCGTYLGKNWRRHIAQVTAIGAGMGTAVGALVGVPRAYMNGASLPTYSLTSEEVAAVDTAENAQKLNMDPSQILDRFREAHKQEQGGRDKASMGVIKTNAAIVGKTALEGAATGAGILGAVPAVAGIVYERRRKKWLKEAAEHDAAQAPSPSR